MLAGTVQKRMAGAMVALELEKAMEYELKLKKP
jgi:hypothetical protein